MAATHGNGTQDETKGPDYARRGSEPGSNPRAFAIGTGAVLQTVGTLLALGGCCLWSTSNYFLRPADVPAARWSDFLFANPIAAAWTIGMLTSFVGGIGLIAAGVGLQGERASSGRIALFVSGTMTLIFVGVALWLVIAHAAYLTAITPLALAVICGFLFALSGHSAAILKRFPPPEDLSRATPEILEEHRRRREERIHEMQ
jgi:hypothetical protein